MEKRSYDRELWLLAYGLIAFCGNLGLLFVISSFKVDLFWSFNISILFMAVTLLPIYILFLSDLNEKRKKKRRNIGGGC